MAETQFSSSSVRWVFVVGIASGILATVILTNLIGSRDGAQTYPVRVQSNSRGLLADLNCVRVSDGSYLVNGFVSAPSGSGILKIGALINFGDTGPLNGINIHQGNFYAYFDTDDPDYASPDGGGGALTFNVIVDNNYSGEPESGGPAPKFCEAFVAKILH